MQLRTIIPVAALALVLAACGATPAAAPANQAAPAAAPANPAAPAAATTIQISEPWARTALMAGEAKPTEAAMAGGEHGSAMGGANSAAYMVIRNTGSAADKLVKAASNVAQTVELHTVEMKDGVMQMRPVEGGIDIPANGEVQLKPGGFHVMLIGLKQDLKAGEKVALTLEFEKAGALDVQADVRMNP